MICISLSACAQKTNDEAIIIKGTIKNLPANKVYLTDAYYPDIIIDSANYVNDTFSFRINPTNYEPLVVSIRFFNKEGKRQLLAFDNYILSNDNKKYGATAFVLDYGITMITGTVESITYNATNNLKIEAGKQNDPFFKTDLTNFGLISEKNENKRGAIINSYKDLINEYPDSYYFIKQLHNYRTQYSEMELNSLIDLFDRSVRNSTYGNKIISYFSLKPQDGRPLPNYLLKDSLNNEFKMIEDSYSLNMLIFWASWCGPCRQEIPELKELNDEFKHKGLRMVSISIDENNKLWETALNKEKMEWQQLIADSSELIEKLKDSYNFSAIPLIVFTDRRGLELGRFSGYDPNQEEQLKNLIMQNISK